MNTVEIIDALAAAPSVDGSKREISASVRLHDDAVSGSDGIFLELSVRHWPDSKRFNISAHLETRKSERGFQTSMWEPMNSRHNLRFAAVPVARYSAKALQAAWDRAIDSLRANPEALESLDLQWKGEDAA